MAMSDPTPTRTSNVLVMLVTAAFVISQLNLALMLLPLRPNVLAIQLAFSAQDYWDILAQWGDAGVALYRHHFLFDGVHPFIYGAFGYLVVTRTALFSHVRSDTRRRLSGQLPMAAFCDVVENLIHLHLLTLTPGAETVWVPVTASFSLVKWGLALVFAVALGAQVARAMRRSA